METCRHIDRPLDFEREPAGDTATFDGDAVEGDVLTYVIPSDGTDASAPVTAEITVENTLPSIGSVAILPLRDTFTHEALACEAQDVRDPDTSSRTHLCVYPACQ